MRGLKLKKTYTGDMRYDRQEMDKEKTEGYRNNSIILGHCLVLLKKLKE